MYYLYAVVPGLLFFSINLKLTKSSKKYIYTLFIIIIVLFSSVRSLGWSKDNINYFTSYLDIKTNFWNYFIYGFKKWEKGYLILNKIASYFIGSSSIRFNFFFALVLILPPSIFFWKNTKNPFLAMALYIAGGGYMTSLSGYRQMCALVIFLVAVEQLKRKNDVKFSLLCLLAFFFHRSAAIFLAFYLFYIVFRKKKIGISIFVFTVIASAALYVSAGQLLNLFRFLTRTPIQVSGSWSMNTLVNELFLCVCLCFSYYYDRSEINENEGKKLMFLMLAFSTTIKILSFPFGDLARLNKFFIPSYCVLLPDSINNMLKRESNAALKVMLSFLIAVAILLLFIHSFYSYYGHFVE